MHTHNTPTHTSHTHTCTFSLTHKYKKRDFVFCVCVPLCAQESECKKGPEGNIEVETERDVLTLTVSKLLILLNHFGRANMARDRHLTHPDLVCHPPRTKITHTYIYVHLHVHVHIHMHMHVRIHLHTY